MKKVTKPFITWFEPDFADHHPARVKEKLDFNEASDAVWNRNNHIARKLYECIAHKFKDHWPRLWRKNTVGAEVKKCLTKDSHLKFVKMSLAYVTQIIVHSLKNYTGTIIGKLLSYYFFIQES